MPRVCRAFRGRRPLPVAYVVITLAAAMILEVAPYIEELWRCKRAAQAQLVPPHSARVRTRRQAL